MGFYRKTRNIEASIIDHIESELISASWYNITTLKGFSKVYDSVLPIIAVRVNVTEFNPLEIGNNKKVRNPQVIIDIFGSDDGNKLDLSDFLIDILKDGIVYYEYEIESGQVKTKTASGRISIIGIPSSTPIEFDTPKSDLDERDRHRQIITLSVSLGKGE